MSTKIGRRRVTKVIHKNMFTKNMFTKTIVYDKLFLTKQPEKIGFMEHIVKIVHISLNIITMEILRAMLELQFVIFRSNKTNVTATVNYRREQVR